MKSKLLAILLTLVLCLGMMPLTAVAAEAPEAADPTITIKKIVKQGGSVTPPAENFVFEAVLPDHDESLEIGTIATNFAENDEYTLDIIIDEAFLTALEEAFHPGDGDDVTIDHFYIGEKQGNAEDWTYADQCYEVRKETLEQVLEYEDVEYVWNIYLVEEVEDGDTIEEIQVDYALFENTYTNDDDGFDGGYFDYYFQSRNTPADTPADTTTDTNPNTGDATGTALWIVLAGMTLFGAAVAVFGRKLRRSK